MLDVRSYLSQLQCSLCSRVSVATFSTDLPAIPLWLSHEAVAGEGTLYGVRYGVRVAHDVADEGCRMRHVVLEYYPPLPAELQGQGCLGRQSPPLIIQPHAAKPKGHDVIVPGPMPGPFPHSGADRPSRPARHTASARLRLGFLFSRAAPGRPKRSFFST